MVRMGIIGPFTCRAVQTSCLPAGPAAPPRRNRRGRSWSSRAWCPGAAWSSPSRCPVKRNDEQILLWYNRSKTNHVFSDKVLFCFWTLTTLSSLGQKDSQIRRTHMTPLKDLLNLSLHRRLVWNKIFVAFIHGLMKEGAIQGLTSPLTWGRDTDHRYSYAKLLLLQQ